MSKYIGDEFIDYFNKHLDIIAINVKKYRLKSGMKKNELAEKAGINSDSVSKIEDAETAMELETLCRLAYALKVRPTQLLRDGDVTNYYLKLLHNMENATEEEIEDFNEWAFKTFGE